MHRDLNLLNTIVTSQLLSITFVIIGKLHVNLLLAYTDLSTNPIVLFLSFMTFMLFCIIANNLILRDSAISIILISISYIIYKKLIPELIISLNNNPNDYGFGILGLSTEVLVSVFQYIIVVVSSIIVVSVHKVNNEIISRNN